jgi:hypothetical protein
VTPRSLLLTVAGAMPSEAAYSLVYNAAPSGGPGGTVPGIAYEGPNTFIGGIVTSRPPGIFGIDTPSNPGEVFPAFGVDLQVVGGTGFLRVIGGFEDPVVFMGDVSNVNVGPNGGSFLVNGFLNSSAESFFGLAPSTPLAGVVTLQLSDPFPPVPPGHLPNKIGSLQLTLVAGTAIVPEPSSLIATGSGLAIAIGYARRIGRRAVRAGA